MCVVVWYVTGSVGAESGWSDNTLKRPYLEMGVCFELNLGAGAGVEQGVFLGEGA